jgi:hypothetical protein
MNWQTVGHIIVGIVIGGSQAVALAFPVDTTLVAACHIIALMAAQIGAGLAVAQRRLIALTPCGHCGKAPDSPAPAPVPKAEAA